VSLLERVDFILVETEEGGNLGAAARVLMNLGIKTLKLVAPKVEDWQRARTLAVHAAELLDHAPRFERLGQAISGAHWVVGLSCRPRRDRDSHPPLDLEGFRRKLNRLSYDQRAALVFGPESCGLANHHLRLCHDVFTLPTSEEYPSLNLAQAVALAAWEVRLAAGLVKSTQRRKGLAASGELEKLMEHMRHTLTVIGFLTQKNPELALADLRRLIARARPQSREIQMLHGIFHCMDVWCSRHGGPPTPNEQNKKRNNPR